MRTEAGALLKDARERQRRTGDDVAKAIGVDPATLSRLEQGKVTHPPAVDVLEAIERELHIPSALFLRAWGYNIPLDKPTYGDTRLEAVAANWAILDDVTKGFFLRTIDHERHRLGLEPLDDVVQIVANQARAVPGS